MNLARSLERRLERLVEGLAGKLFPGNLSAPELAQRLVREADLSVTDGLAGPVAPNVYGVRLHPDDLGSDEAPADLTAELATVITDHASQQGWRLEGGVAVQVVTDPTMASGTIHIAASVVAGALPRWAYLVPKSGAAPFDLMPNRCLIGRDHAADVRLGNDAVSRHHALIWREGSDVWLADLGSSNGTSLNGAPVLAPSRLDNGDAIVFGPFECTFRRA